MKILFIILLLISTNVYAAPPSRVSNYVSGTTIRASDVSSNENAIFNYLQAGVDTFLDGSITNADISSSASIGYSKLSLNSSITSADIVDSTIVTGDISDGTIVNVDVSASAGIVDTKLATISTAGKVSGAALTSLASTPSGAGIIPVANLGSGSPSSSNFLRGDGSFAVAGNYTLISSTSVSANTTSGSITISAGKTYKVIIEITMGASIGSMFLRVNNDTDTQYGWNNTVLTMGTSPTETHTGHDAIDYIQISSTVQANNPFIAEALLSTYASVYDLHIIGSGVTWSGGVSRRVDFSGFYNDQTPTSFTLQSDNNYSGTIYLYELTR